MKFIKYVAAVLLTIGLLGCSTENENEAVANETITNTEEVVKEDVQALSNEEDDYVQEVMDISKRLETEFLNFSELNYELADNPTLMYDDSFVMEAAQNITWIDGALDDILKLDPPKKFTESDDLLKKAAHEYKFMTENYPEAFDNMDVYLMDEITERMMLGNDYLDEATNVVEGIK